MNEAYNAGLLPLDKAVIDQTYFFEELIDATTKLEVYKGKIKDNKLDSSWFMPTLQQKEALASSMLEGTQATLDGFLTNQITPNNKDKNLNEVVALWFMFEIGAVVIPNISFPTEESAAFALDGYEDCSVVAMSTKSHMQNQAEYERLQWKIRFTVDTLNLKAIVVYDVCSSNEKVIECFAYAIANGVEIIIPDNTLKSRNRERRVMHNG